MKYLGTVLASIVLLTLPATAASPSVSGFDAFIAASTPQLEQIEKMRGMDVDWSEAQVFDSFAFELPAGTDFYTVNYDWVNGEGVVVPGSGAPDNGGDSGCLTVGVPLLLGSVGWTNTPVGAGNTLAGCTYQAHGGGFTDDTLACVVGTFCLIDALHLGGFFDYVTLACIGTGAHVATFSWSTFTGTQTHVPSGICFVFGFAFFLPPTWVGYDSLVAGDGVALGTHA